MCFLFSLGIGRAGGVGGACQGLVHHLLMQLFTQSSSKIELSKNNFFDTVIT